MIYCHFDGYLQHLGIMLAGNYQTLEAVEQLISMGDARSVYHTIEDSEFYRRDREEPFAKVACRFFENFDALWAAAKQEYLYLFRQDTGKWYVSCRHTAGDLDELDLVLDKKPWEKD
jgi:hypothetical protein